MIGMLFIAVLMISYDERVLPSNLRFQQFLLKAIYFRWFSFR